MRIRPAFTLSLLLLTILLTVSNPAHAQTPQGAQRDKLWDGMLIGAGVGAVVGMLVAPPAFCGGGHDSECAAIVRVAIGLPAIAGGIGLGALVDGLRHSDTALPAGGGRASRPRVSGLQMTVSF